MMQTDQVLEQDSLTALTGFDDQSVDVILTDPPYPNRMNLFTDAIVDAFAALYLACRKAKKFVAFFWNPFDVPRAPPGWFEVARHVWHKPDCKSITHYEVIVVWSREERQKVSRVWSIPILDYRSLRDWKPHPTQKPVRLMRYLLEQLTQEGDLVVDPFAGTGSTAVACKQMKRHYIAIEKNPEYAKIATDRLTSKRKEDEEPEKHDDANDEETGDVEENPQEPATSEATEVTEDASPPYKASKPLTKPRRRK